MPGLIGKKIGMTRLFAEDGTVIPVTAIEAGPCPIVQVRTEERDGYRAIQLGFGRRKERRTRQPDSGHAAGAGLEYAPAVLKEFRLGEDDRIAEDPHTPGRTARTAAVASGAEEDAAEEAGTDGADSESAVESGAEENEAGTEGGPQTESGAVATAEAAEGGFRVGQALTVEIFQPGDRVKVTGRTKGRGFQGVVKRHGFGGRPGSHGHASTRVPGSIGPGTNPSRVMKGRRMGGRMGGEQRTVRNLEVVRVDPERNLVFIRGSVPGARNSRVYIRKQ